VGQGVRPACSCDDQLPVMTLALIAPTDFSCSAVRNPGLWMYFCDCVIFLIDHYGWTRKAVTAPVSPHKCASFSSLALSASRILRISGASAFAPEISRSRHCCAFFIRHQKRAQGVAAERASNLLLRQRSAAAMGLKYEQGRARNRLTQAIVFFGAGDRDRTGDIQLGKLTFYH